MKKIIITIFLCFVSILLTSCFKKSSNKPIDNLKKLIKALDNKDSRSVKSFFCKKTINENSNFDEQISSLLSYYEGTMKSYTESSPAEYYDTNNGKKRKWYHYSNDITTDKNVYRLSIEWYVENTFDNETLGITSLYIIKWDDNYDNNIYYWGDGKYTSGINVGISNKDSSE